MGKWKELAEPPCKIGTQCIGGKCLQCVQPEQEPVAWRNKETGEFCSGGFLRNQIDKWQSLYAAPQQRDETPAKAVEWKGLTDEQVKQIEMSASSTLSAIYLTEAQLKGKNT